MPFQIGQRVRCTTRAYEGRRELAQFGEEFTVLDVLGAGGSGNIWLTEKGHGHGNLGYMNIGYNPEHFELVSPVVIGSLVTCIDSRRSRLRHGQQYVVWGIRDDKYLINGSWVKASRFGRQPTVRKPVVSPYEVTRYYGCCGAGIIYFGNGPPTEDRVQKTIETLTLPGYVCVLNGVQQKQSGAMLEASGFKFVGKTASGSGRQHPLYHYLYTKIEAELPPERVTEAPRVF
jgi:hypothetical protein